MVALLQLLADLRIQIGAQINAIGQLTERVNALEARQEADGEIA